MLTFLSLFIILFSMLNFLLWKKAPQPEPGFERIDEEDYICEPVSRVGGESFIKKYKKLKMIGSGTFSRCYLVQSVDSNSLYAAKVIDRGTLDHLE